MSSQSADLSLHSLPDVLLVDIFSEWIKLKDLAKFDTATCNKVDRAAFLSLVQTDEFIVRGVFYEETSEKYDEDIDDIDDDDDEEYLVLSRNPVFMWIVLRQLKCQNAKFETSERSALWATLTDLNHNHVVLEVTKSVVALWFEHLSSVESSGEFCLC